MSTKFDLVVTFLALLEMTRLKMTRLFQSEPFGPLHIELAAAPEPPDGGATPVPTAAEGEDPPT